MEDEKTLLPESHVVSCTFKIADDPAEQMDAMLAARITDCNEYDEDGMPSIVLHFEVSFRMVDSANIDDELLEIEAVTETRIGIGNNKESSIYEAACSGYIMAMTAINVVSSLSPINGLSMPTVDIRKAIESFYSKSR